MSQPEALSRCCTPLSPGIPHMASTGMLAEVSNVSRASKAGIDPLPFNEVEASAASKQEHVISVVSKSDKILSVLNQGNWKYVWKNFEKCCRESGMAKIIWEVSYFWENMVYWNFKMNTIEKFQRNLIKYYKNL